MASHAPSGICRLCLREEELTNSHIASKFLWRESGVIGKQKKFSLVSPNYPNLNDSNCQDGPKEFLLCRRCEGQFGRYETCASRALFGRSGPAKLRPMDHHPWTGLDYVSLKLFQMSILWRMGVSGHPFYCNVVLGDHAEILGKMLLAEDPGEPWQYGSVVTLLNYNGVPISGLFSQPRKMRVSGHNGYVYTIAGMRFLQLATLHAPSEEVFTTVLQQDGSWVLFRGEMTDFPELRGEVESRRAPHRGFRREGL